MRGSRKEPLKILPPLALLYFAGSLLLVAAVLLALDRLVIPAAEKEGRLVSWRWRQENDRRQRFMGLRNQATVENPVWRSDLWPVSPQRRKGSRILVIGDSFAWGDGVTNLNSIWWRQLERELERRGYADVEVVGAGMVGASTRQQLAWAERLVPLYRPDLIIWSYVVNDPEEMSAATGKHIVPLLHLEIPEDGFARRVRPLLDRLIPDVSDQLFRIREGNRKRVLSGPRYGYDAADWELKVLEGESLASYRKTVADLGRFVAASGVPSFVLSLPNGFSFHAADRRPFFAQMRDYYSARYAPVKGIFEGSGLSFVDTVDDLAAALAADRSLDVEHYPLRLGVNPANGHPGALASHVYAVRAADVLESRYPQVLGRRAGGKGAAAPSGAAARVNDSVPPFLMLESEGSGRYSLVYPESNDLCLRMPLGKPYIQLNFERPVPLDAVRLSGTDLKQAELFLTAEDAERGFDDERIAAFGLKKGSSLSWAVSGRGGAVNASTLRLSARFRGPDRSLRLELTAPGGGP